MQTEAFDDVLHTAAREAEVMVVIGAVIGAALKMYMGWAIHQQRNHVPAEDGLMLELQIVASMS